MSGIDHLKFLKLNIVTVAAVISFSGCGRFDEKKPQLIASSMKIQLDRFRQFEEHPFSISVWSNGPPLKIRMVASSCGCVAPNEVKPGTLISETPTQFGFVVKTTTQTGVIDQIVHFEAETEFGEVVELNIGITYSVEATPKFVSTTPFAVRFENDDSYFFEGVLSILRGKDDKPILLDDITTNSDFGSFALTNSSAEHVAVSADGKLIDDRFSFRLSLNHEFARPEKLIFGCSPNRTVTVPIQYQEIGAANLTLDSVFGGILEIGESVRKSVTVKNVSLKPILISNVSYSGDDGVTVTPMSSKALNAGESCEIEFNIVGQGTQGRQSGKLTIDFLDKEITDLDARLSWIVKE